MKAAPSLRSSIYIHRCESQQRPTVVGNIQGISTMVTFLKQRPICVVNTKPAAGAPQLPEEAHQNLPSMNVHYLSPLM